MSSIIKKTVSILGVTCLMAFASSANAVTYGFDVISNNSQQATDLAEANISVEVTDPGSDQVRFKFLNTDYSTSAAITDVYFDWDIQGGTDTPVDNSSGVISTSSSGADFTEGARPSSLPGGNDPSVGFSADWSADSDQPVRRNGVSAGEWLIITFDLMTGYSFSDLNNLLLGQEALIGVHVQGSCNGESLSLVSSGGTPTTPPVLTPAPAALSLLCLGLLGLSAARRRIINI